MNARRIAIVLVILAVNALVGAALFGAAGFWLWQTFVPHGGCGDIGCWDALQGAFIGVAVGGLGMPISAALWMRRRSRRGHSQT